MIKEVEEGNLRKSLICHFIAIIWRCLFKLFAVEVPISGISLSHCWVNVLSRTVPFLNKPKITLVRCKLIKWRRYYALRCALVKRNRPLSDRHIVQGDTNSRNGF